jgi:hypothetical protein
MDGHARARPPPAEIRSTAASITLSSQHKPSETISTVSLLVSQSDVVPRTLHRHDVYSTGHRLCPARPPPGCIKSTHFHARAHSRALASRRSFQHVPDSSSRIVLALLLLASLCFDESVKTNGGREQQHGRRRLVWRGGAMQWDEDRLGVKRAQDVEAG